MRRVVHLQNESPTAGMQIDLLGKRSPLVGNFPSGRRREQCHQFKLSSSFLSPLGGPVSTPFSNSIAKLPRSFADSFSSTVIIIQNMSLGGLKMPEYQNPVLPATVFAINLEFQLPASWQRRQRRSSNAAERCVQRKLARYRYTSTRFQTPQSRRRAYIDRFRLIKRPRSPR